MARSSNELTGSFWALKRKRQDPIWASSSLLARVRKQLSDFDPYLDLWWSPNRGIATGDTKFEGRWRVVRYGPRGGGWQTWFYLIGPNGEYRSPENLELVMRKLRANQVLSTKLLMEKSDHRESRLREKKLEFLHKDVRNELMSAYDYFMGRKVYRNDSRARAVQRATIESLARAKKRRTSRIGGGR